MSGIVRRLVARDCCPERVSLRVRHEECHFKDIVSLMNGKKISITPTNAAFLEACAFDLENDELLDRIMGLHLEGLGNIPTRRSLVKLSCKHLLFRVF